MQMGSVAAFLLQVSRMVGIRTPTTLSGIHRRRRADKTLDKTNARRSPLGGFSPT
jgi:hypothetical protein